MRTKFIIVSIAIMLLVTAVTHAQESQPTGKYLIWAGAGVSGYDTPKVNGISGFGTQIAQGKWLLTNMISTRQQSTLAESYIQEIATQGPVTLFGLGEVGIATGHDLAQFAVGAGGGLMLDVCKYIHPGLKDFQIAGAVKITKPTGDTNSAAVKPVFITGIIYRIGR
jgi:hypothetical protein